MANNCNYEMKIAGKSKEAVEQFCNALKYEDMKNGYFMCRIFSAYTEEVKRSKDGTYYAEVNGDCAWSVKCCMIENDYGEWHGIAYGEPEFYVWRGWEGRIKYSNIGMTAGMLCKALGVAVEIWSNEPGIGFQEHYVIGTDGTVIESECEDWTEGYDTDENGDFLDCNPEKDEGGFEDYGGYYTAEELVEMKGEEVDE